MAHYTKAGMQILESIVRNQGFSLRYEKGNFHSGYCLLNHKKVVIVNKFFDKESRFNVLAEILGQIPLDKELLDEGEIKILNRVAPSWTAVDLFNPSAKLAS